MERGFHQSKQMECERHLVNGIESVEKEIMKFCQKQRRGKLKLEDIVKLHNEVKGLLKAIAEKRAYDAYEEDRNEVLRDFLQSISELNMTIQKRTSEQPALPFLFKDILTFLEKELKFQINYFL